MATTFPLGHTISAKSAEVHHDPLPTSKTLSQGCAWSRSSINATVIGWEFVCPRPIGKGMLWSACHCCADGRKFFLSIVSNAWMIEGVLSTHSVIKILVSDDMREEQTKALGLQNFLQFFPTNSCIH